MSTFVVWTLLLLVCLVSSSGALTQIHRLLHRQHETAWTKLNQSSSPDTTLPMVDSSDEVSRLKRELLQLAASYDRGYGASPSAKRKVEEIVKALEPLNEETDAAQGILGGSSSPLRGNWRMVWTTAQDVLVLGASPFTTVGAIYQNFRPPVVTNIIDFIPKAQALLPAALIRPTLIRAEVTTRASPRPKRPMRVGLNFESVQLKPVEVLGFEADGILPPLGFDLPQIDIPGTDPETAPGYFDVMYLDDELLIIQQNAPGGMFALVKVPENDP